MSKKTEYTPSSGNVFRDMNLPDSEEMLVKAKLAMRIETILNQRNLKQTEAAKLLGITQPKVSALLNGQLRGFSLEKLICFLKRLDQNVEINVSNKPKTSTNRGKLRIAFD